MTVVVWWIGVACVGLVVLAVDLRVDGLRLLDDRSIATVTLLPSDLAVALLLAVAFAAALGLAVFLRAIFYSLIRQKTGRCTNTFKALD